MTLILIIYLFIELFYSCNIIFLLGQVTVQFTVLHEIKPVQLLILKGE